MATAPNLRSDRRSFFTHGLLFGTGVATGGAATWLGSRARPEDAPTVLVEDVIGGGEPDFRWAVYCSAYLIDDPHIAADLLDVYCPLLGTFAIGKQPAKAP